MRRNGVKKMMACVASLAVLAAACGLALEAGAAEKAKAKAPAARLKLGPYTGPCVAGVDTTTLEGKVMCGYQGWFSTPTDGAGMGWTHYSTKLGFNSDHCGIDLWPDVSEFTAAEKYETPLRLADGRPAMVYSSINAQTIRRHFEWMREYGIDGVFVQRFASYAFSAAPLAKADTVLVNCRAAANQTGRAYALMYDLSGLTDDKLEILLADWKRLVDEMRLGRDAGDKAYMRHNGKPVVAVWGIGFGGSRVYSLETSEKFVEFLKNDPKYGGFSVMVGVPFGWRGSEESPASETFLSVVAKADIVSPWSVGRYRTPKEAGLNIGRRQGGDISWCEGRKMGYMPVIFPGFSWYNMQSARGDKTAKVDQIPRLGGEFLWSQYCAVRQAGAKMLYVAMFDEMDEGTAIFKCTRDVPVGNNKFVREGLPSDHYLWLVGQIAKNFRSGEAPPSQMPRRSGATAPAGK